MNKSKFLKKSLAALLAVMLVVAMIPLSAAAEGLVPKIYVNNDGPAELSGGTFSISTGNVSTAVLSWEAPDTGTNGNALEITFKDKWGEKINWNTSIPGNTTKTQAVDLDQVASVNADKTQYTLSIHTVETKAGTNDETIENDYTLVITKKETAAKENADVQYVHSSVGAVDAVVSQDTITITMPFGKALPAELTTSLPYEGGVVADTNGAKLSKLKHWFQPVKPDDIATMTWATSSDSRYNYTLKLQTKGQNSNMVVTKTYNVLVKYEKGFTAFTVPDQIGDTRFTDNDTIIDIDVPANYLKKDVTDWSKLIISTFTLDPKWSKVETATVMNQSAAGTAVTSGATGLSFQYNSDNDGAVNYTRADSTTVSIADNSGLGVIELNVVSATDSSKKVPVLVRLHEQTNAQNELKTVQYFDTAVAKSVETEVVEGTTVIKVPNNYTIPSAQNANYGLEVVASENATVSVDGQQEVAVQKVGTAVSGLYAGNTDYALFSVTNIQPNLTLSVRVTPQDGSAPKVYSVKIEKDIAQGQIHSFIIKKPDGTVTLTGVPNAAKREVRIPVPYKYANNSTLATWKVFITPTAGTTMSFQNQFLNGVFANGSADATYANVFNINDKTGTSTAIAIGDPLTITLTELDGTTTVDWKVIIDAESPNKSHQLFTSGQELVGTDNFGEITSDNTYTDIKVGTGVDTSGNKINTIEVSVPWSFNATHLSFTKLAMSTNASMWIDTGSAWGTDAVTAMPTTSYTDHLGTISVTANRITNALNSSNQVVTANAVKVYVLSEEATGNGVAKPELTWANRDNGKATPYYLYCVKAAPKTGHDIISIESTTDKNVTARLNPVTKHVEINVPASYAQATAGGPGFDKDKVKFFSLNFKLSDQATMRGDKATSGLDSAIEIKSDNGTTATSNRTMFYVHGGKLGYVASVSDYPNPIQQVTASGATVAGPAVNGYLRVFAENDVVSGNRNYEDYTVEFKIDPWQTEAKLNTLSVNGYNGKIGELDKDSKATVELELPVGTNLAEQTIDLTVSKTATVTVNGFNWSADRKFNLNNDATIVVTSEDKSKVNTYTLKTSLSQGFNDVRESDWFYKAVMEAVNNGWVKGDGNGNFLPYGNMTRGQFALIIARMDSSFVAIENTPITDCPFPDVNDVPTQNAAKYMKEKGYMQGDNEGNFNPNAPITREQAAIVLCNFKGVAPEDGATSYTDNSSISSWAVKYVKAATTAGYFKGNERNQFEPARQMYRCEGAQILVNSAK